jgi:methylene-tetrahydromethanopterin dehydrogenase
MADKNILHLVTATKHASPFDANMALDAGYDAVLSYTNVTLEEITGLVQDAIFSRPPAVGVRTGMFFGGKNASLALDMLAKAKQALVPPFGISFFADPAGSFTTAGAMVACVEKLLGERKRRSLQGLKVAVFGATGVVGFASAVLAAREGADVTLVGHDGIKRVSDGAKEIKARFGLDVRAADGSDEQKKSAILAESEAAFCAGRAGVQVLSGSQIAAAKSLVIVADVNAVPPPGVEGLDVQANGQELTAHGTLGLGPLAIGNIKYKTEFGLFQKMIAAKRPLQLDFRDAFALARELNA